VEWQDFPEKLNLCPRQQQPLQNKFVYYTTRWSGIREVFLNELSGKLEYSRKK
jgi:hypothetical protein